MIKSIYVKDFNLQHTVECGQFFRVIKKGNWYYLGYKNRIFKVMQQDNRLYFSNTDEKFIRYFFHLNFDYDKIFNNQKNSHIAKARKQFRGLRIIQQDPWECLISYICSANNNIPKIKGMISNLCRTFGKKLQLDGVIMYSFPDPGSMNKKSKVKKCVYTDVKTKSILNINKTLTSSQLNQLKNRSYDEVLLELTSLYGVGPKIANCVMLFSLGFFKAVPIDTHMKKVLIEKYNLKDSCDTKLTNKAIACFGKYGGILGQYLFYQQRLNS